MNAWVRVTFVTLWFVAAALSCGGNSSSVTPTRTLAQNGQTASIAVTQSRFPHGLHTGTNPQIVAWRGGIGLQCNDCHTTADVKAGIVARPGGGTNVPSIGQHAPCDACHKAEFSKPPGPLCKVCHDSVDPMVKGSSVLRQFPDKGTIQSLASGFSHRLHLDADKMESETGSHVSCADCHARDANGDPILPSHKQCLACHDKSAAATKAVAMEKCSGCHLQRNVDIKRGRIFIIGDLKFSHAKHETDNTGAAVACTTCHEGVKDSSKRDDMAVPAMERCATCHDDARRSPDAVRMGNCAVCHAQIQSGDPPTNHMVSGALPTDHTLEFRHDHGTQAAAPDAPCRYCHQVSGRKEDSCFQCHQTMKPRDHNIMFRDDHGREAEADGSRCATCHQPETCAACHSVPPRSHSPLGAFAQGGHAEQARFNLTACLTCHTYANTCAQCHRGTR